MYCVFNIRNFCDSLDLCDLNFTLLKCLHASSILANVAKETTRLKYLNVVLTVGFLGKCI